MIKFFRRIRQRLLSENRFSKYVLYAVGEIVLVVIGILIALQINTWNQARQASNKEHAYLNSIEADLEQQLAYIDLQLEHELEYDSVAQVIMANYRQHQALTIDSVLSAQMHLLTIRKTFTKADPTYQDLISTGNFGLIKDETLRSKILSYYMELERIERIMLNNNTLFVDQMFAMKLVDHVFLMSERPVGEADQRLFDITNALLQDPEREMQVVNLIDFRANIAQGHVQFMIDLRAKTEIMRYTIQRLK